MQERDQRLGVAQLGGRGRAHGPYSIVSRGGRDGRIAVEELYGFQASRDVAVVLELVGEHRRRAREVIDLQGPSADIPSVASRRTVDRDRSRRLFAVDVYDTTRHATVGEYGD